MSRSIPTKTRPEPHPRDQPRPRFFLKPGLVGVYSESVHVYLVGICGTGMGSLATLLAQAGHTVSGSDPSPRPPMSDVLASKGIAIHQGWEPNNLDLSPRPDLVVVGNVCRADNPEAARAAELGIERLSMPGAVRKLLIPGSKPLVVAGTHGKTTTTALLGVLLLRAGLDPTILVGGVSADIGGSSRLGHGDHLVIEGDEYDSAFFEKIPKFWSYDPHGLIVTSVQHDHLDIYPDEASYVAAFEELLRRVDPRGRVAVWAGDDQAVRVTQGAPCEVRPYALEGERSFVDPTYRAKLRPGGGCLLRSELVVTWPDGSKTVFHTPMAGRHNARNALAAIILAREICGLTITQISQGLASFKGVALRQQHVATRRSIRIYRDFAHHPEAVAETIRALRPLASPGRLLVAYEPRTATACRRIHQREYVLALAEADDVVLAPVARTEIDPEDRLDTAAIARSLRSAGMPATAASSIEELVAVLVRRARPGDLVALLSNGHFGGADRLLQAALEERR